MTIQILQATDNNPPKISFLSIFKPSKAKKNYFYIIRYSPMSRPNNHKIKIELG